MAKIYKHSVHFGPGGMRCPCCNETPGSKRSMKATKRHINRKFRRDDKLALKAHFGYTLVELMVVVALLSMIIGGVALCGVLVAHCNFFTF